MSKIDKKKLMITDLDAPAKIELTETIQHKKHKSDGRRQGRLKVLKTIPENLNVRSRSVECGKEGETDDKGQDNKNGIKLESYFNALLQTKNKQIDEMLERIATLHNYNEKFAIENERQREDMHALHAHILGLEKRIDNCDSCRELTKQLKKKEEICNILSEDVDMLKTLVYRLNKQIEQYQNKNSDMSDQSDQCNSAMKKKLPQEFVLQQECHQVQQSSNNGTERWVLQTAVLKPLLQAYDETISDKERLLKRYQQDLECFSSELKFVLAENQRLVASIERIQHDLRNWEEERTSLQVQLKTYQKKLTTLMQQSDMAKEKLIEVMNCYEQKIQALLLDMQHLQTAYKRCKSELASFISLQAEPKDSVSTSLQECKELLVQLKQSHCREKQALERTIAEMNLHGAQLQEENDRLKQNLDERNAALQTLRQKYHELQGATEKLKNDRGRLKARLRIALQWANKLEQSQFNVQNTCDALKRLETLVKHRESQVRGLQARYLTEIDKLEKRLAVKGDTIRTILKSRLKVGNEGTRNVQVSSG